MKEKVPADRERDELEQIKARIRECWREIQSLLIRQGRLETIADLQSAPRGRNPNSESRAEAEDRDAFYRDGPDGGGEA